jgi:CheY-like chemotaxis protein
MGNQIDILLVEDEVITAMVLEEQLKSIHYPFSHHVTTGENAIISARQNPPDVILMDIRLAGEIDGIEAASIIKSELDIPIIFITGYDEENIKERAAILKPLAFLIKPLAIKKLKSILDDYCASLKQ